jgi:hypothetical protein
VTAARGLRVGVFAAAALTNATAYLVTGSTLFAIAAIGSAVALLATLAGPGRR